MCDILKLGSFKQLHTKKETRMENNRRGKNFYSKRENEELVRKWQLKKFHNGISNMYLRTE